MMHKGISFEDLNWFY